MRNMRTAGAAIVTAIAIATTSCSSATKTESTAAPSVTVPGYLACGAAAANLGEPTLPRDRIQLTITIVGHAQASITVGYQIGSPFADQGLEFPLDPVPPTLVLIHDNAIAGVQPTEPEALPSGVVNAMDPVIRPLPYRGRLTLTRLCPGQSWSTVWRDRARYEIAVVMTRQTGPVPSASARFLSEAVAAL